MRAGQTRALIIRAGHHFAEGRAPATRTASCPVCGKSTSRPGNACGSHAQERRQRRVRFAAYRDQATTDEERAFWAAALEKNG